MSAASVECKLQANEAQIIGVMNTSTLPELIRTVAQQNWPADTTLNLQHVSQVDSAALATLMHWVSEAEAQHHPLRIINPPDTLLAIAHLSQLEHLFEPTEACDQ